MNIIKMNIIKKILTSYKRTFFVKRTIRIIRRLLTFYNNVLSESTLKNHDIAIKRAIILFDDLSFVQKLYITKIFDKFGRDAAFLSSDFNFEDKVPLNLRDLLSLSMIIYMFKYKIDPIIVMLNSSFENEDSTHFNDILKKKITYLVPFFEFQLKFSAIFFSQLKS